jgi:hypothetical protein
MIFSIDAKKAFHYSLMIKQLNKLELESDLPNLIKSISETSTAKHST